jgi:hypothetical protein
MPRAHRNPRTRRKPSKSDNALSIFRPPLGPRPESVHHRHPSFCNITLGEVASTSSPTDGDGDDVCA